MVKNLVRWRTAKAAVGDDPATAKAAPVKGAPDILFRAVAIDPPGATMVPGTGPGPWKVIIQVNLGGIFAWAVVTGMIDRRAGMGGRNGLAICPGHAITKRFGVVEEGVDGIVQLASDCSSCKAGRLLVVNGGESIDHCASSAARCGLSDSSRACQRTAGRETGSAGPGPTGRRPRACNHKRMWSE